MADAISTLFLSCIFCLINKQVIVLNILTSYFVLKTPKKKSDELEISKSSSINGND